MEADRLRENPQTPQQQETLQSNHLRLQKADAPSFSSKQSSHQTKRNHKKLPSTGFKQQAICIPLAPTRKKIIYKIACSDGPNSGSGKASQTGFAQKDLPSCSSGRHKPQSFIETKTVRFCDLDTKKIKKMNLNTVGPHAAQ